MPTKRKVCAWSVGLLLGCAIIVGISCVRADMVTARVKDSSDDPGTETKEASAPVSASQKAAEMPHFWQRDPRGEFENGGRDYCCPVSVSNSFVYLAHHGFPDLLSKGEGDQPQIDLINLLASPDYMGTDPENGTSPGQVIYGVQKYVEAQGYTCERLEYEGWRKLGRKQQDFIKADRVDLDWVKKAILDPHGAVWLNVGWYTRTGDGQWKRFGGHWVTLAGVDATDPNALIVHNPLVHALDAQPDDPTKDMIHLQQTSSGTLDTGKGTTQDAAGRYQVSGPGLPKGQNTVAFLDAAIVFVIGK